jgi:hypothetical protein
MVSSTETMRPKRRSSVGSRTITAYTEVFAKDFWNQLLPLSCWACYHSERLKLFRNKMVGLVA